MGDIDSQCGVSTLYYFFNGKSERGEREREREREVIIGEEL